jgi:hypothetical protein
MEVHAMGYRCLCLGSLLLLDVILVHGQSNAAVGQSNAGRICVVEADSDIGATLLAKQLAGKELHNGSHIVAIRIIAADHRLLDADVERANCRYTVTMWHHELISDNPPTDIPSSVPGDPTLSVSMPDRSVVGYKLRMTGKKKVILAQSAPPLTVYVKQDKRVFNPYVMFANKIVNKLNELNGAR